MSIPNSVLAKLLQALPALRPQIYFKSSLTALSHAMEDQVLADSEQPLVIASFQRERFYRQEAHRYRRIAEKTDHLYVLAAPETNFTNSSQDHETIAFEPSDSLAQEWHLVVIGQQFVSCLVCQERNHSSSETDLDIDNSRRFDGIWTFDRQVSNQVAAILLKQVLKYRPELAKKVKQAHKRYLRPQGARERESRLSTEPMSNPDPFVQRLVTYLQAGQYKLIKANCSLATKQQQEQLFNSVIAAIRRSLNPHEILQVAVEKLGEGLNVGRCIVYRCQETDQTATIHHEFLNLDINSLKGQTWSLQDNPLFQKVVKNKESLSITDVANEPRFQAASVQALLALAQNYAIVSWLLVPVLYQDRLMGMIELHHCQTTPLDWKDEEINLVNAIATQIGVALIQAEAYANLEDLNGQLEALDRTRSNLVAITGHELRTPLSTIQVCLESLASEPEMSLELRQVMLNTALTDAERMRKLVQDFLTLSQLESGRVEWHPEALSLQECLDLSLSHVRAHNAKNNLPQIQVPVFPELPLVRADGEWLVEVLSKLLDNACKFTGADGQVTIQISRRSSQSLEVTIADTGRGIEPNRLESVFDRFYQEEGALRRSAGGTGLGLAICRQIVNGWGGEIWAESAGKNHGSQFHFTLPIFNPSTNVAEADNNGYRTTAPRRGRRQKKQ